MVNGQIYLFHNQGASFKDCTGSDVVRQASAAYAKGLDYWEYKKYTLGGVGPNGLPFIGQSYGALTQVICTVLSPGTNANATMQITFSTLNSASNFAADGGAARPSSSSLAYLGQRTVTLPVSRERKPVMAYRSAAARLRCRHCRLGVSSVTYSTFS